MLVIRIDIIFIKRNSVFWFFKVLRIELISNSIFELEEFDFLFWYFLVFELLFWVIYRGIRKLIWWDFCMFFVFFKVWLLNLFMLELLIVVLFVVGEK